MDSLDSFSTFRSGYLVSIIEVFLNFLLASFLVSLGDFFSVNELDFLALFGQLIKQLLNSHLLITSNNNVLAGVRSMQV